MSRMRIAVIGLGMASQPHAASLRDLVDRIEVAAAWSPTAARREEFGARWQMPVADDLDAILADRTIGAVMILTPPSTHLELVERAAAAGKHILLEKPLEILTSRAETLVEIAERAGVTLGVVFQNRFRPSSLALERLIAQGRLGEIVSASLRLRNWRAQSYYDEPGRGTLARDGGGVLMTQAIHPIDQLIAFAGQPAEAMAYATTTPVHRMETEDLAACALRWSGGAIGTLTATTCAYPGRPTEIEIVGTDGMAVLSDDALSVALRDGTTIEEGANANAGGAGADPMAFHHAYHQALIADFLDAVAEGRAPKCDGKSALRSHDLIDAVLASAWAGTAAKVRQR